MGTMLMISCSMTEPSRVPVNRKRSCEGRNLPPYYASIASFGSGSRSLKSADEYSPALFSDDSIMKLDFLYTAQVV